MEQLGGKLEGKRQGTLSDRDFFNIRVNRLTLMTILISQLVGVKLGPTGIAKI
jgi:hypothetical protein